MLDILSWVVTLCITNMLSLDEKEFTANGNTAGLKKPLAIDQSTNQVHMALAAIIEYPVII